MVKGILFKPDMIQAIIEGRKTQTRRVIKQAIHEFKSLEGTHIEIAGAVLPARDKGFVAWWPGEYQTGFLPPYQVGEVIYVKEAWYESKYFVDRIYYKADDSNIVSRDIVWKSPLFMPQRAARYFIKITGVRAERLQEMTCYDAEAEGFALVGMEKGCSACDTESHSFYGGRKHFAEYWNSINPKVKYTGGWEEMVE